VQVHDFGVSLMPTGEQAAWMVLEWLTGRTLDDELTSRRGQGGRTPAECLDLVRPVLSGLAVVHAAGVAHRDLKPANIMLVPSPGGAIAKLLDFGIAKIMEPDERPGSGQTQTRSNQVAFSPAYASPEQISHGRSGPWTDVHATALMLTEILTDRPPLDGREPGLLFQQIVDRVRPTPGRLGVEVGAWEAVLCRALAVSPSERYRDASEFLRALEATVADATATALALRPNPTLSAASADARFAETEPAPEPRLHATTSSPTSADATAHRLSRARTPLYAACGALIVATLAGAAWQRRLTVTPEQYLGADADMPLRLASASASALPVATVVIPSASNAPLVTPPEPIVSARRLAPRQRQLGSGVHVTAPSGSSSARPRPEGKLVVE
jgi:serine/threonine protein kinase